MQRANHICGILALCGWGASAAAAQSPYEAYTDWLGWARLQPGAHAGLASSYDRTGGNDDFSQYESPPGPIIDQIPCVVKTISGPGIIHRFWMPHLTANRVFEVRMYFDGESEPRIDTTSDVIFAETFAYFSAPLVTTAAGGQVCYEPIPFAESVRIETTNRQLPASGWSPNRHYYQYSYTTFPAGTPITTYSSDLSPSDAAARDAVAAMFTTLGEHPAGPSGTAIQIVTPGQAVPPAGVVTLADLSGPGVVRSIKLRMDGATDEELAGLRLIVEYDCGLPPAIDASVSEFFGAGLDRAAYRSLPLGTDGPDGFYCFWPMPYRHSISIRIQNTTGSPIAIDSASIEYESMPINDDLCYLHARVSSRQKQPGDIYHPVLSTSGRGHYLGHFLFLHQLSWSFFMLEGDDVATVDGTAVTLGTGLEDAFNGGYYYNWVGVQAGEPEGAMPQSAIRPLHGILHVHREDGVQDARADQYRWYIADRIPFLESFEFKIENQYAISGSDWTSVAFWYQQPAADGDINDDSALDDTDVALFVDVLLGLDADPHRRSRADLNHDCRPDGIDVSAFVAAYVGA